MLEVRERDPSFAFQRRRGPPSLTSVMIKRIISVILLCGSVAIAADNPSPASPSPSTPPSEASIKQLLEVAQARKLVDSVMAQMDNLMQQTIAQPTRGQKIPDKV